MFVKDLVTELLKMPQDMEIMFEYDSDKESPQYESEFTKGIEINQTTLYNYDNIYSSFPGIFVNGNVTFQTEGKPFLLITLI